MSKVAIDLNFGYHDTKVIVDSKDAMAIVEILGRATVGKYDWQSETYIKQPKRAVEMKTVEDDQIVEPEVKNDNQS